MQRNLLFAPAAHKKLVRFLKGIFLQPDKELVVETTGGDREQPGTAARVADLELCHPAHVCFKVGIDDDSDYGDIDVDCEDEDDYYLELSQRAYVCPKVMIIMRKICSELPFSF